MCYLNIQFPSNSPASPLDMYKEFPKTTLVATILGISFVAIALAAFFCPGFWQGDVFPSLKTRIIALTALSTGGTIIAMEPLVEGTLFCLCLKKNLFKSNSKKIYSL